MVKARRNGYSLPELAIVLGLFSIVMSVIYTVVQSQQRFYADQASLADAREAVRVAVAVLSGELRDVSPSGGDLYVIASDSLALRSTTGFGFVCGSGPGFVDLRMITGSFGRAAADSALVFIVADPGSSQNDHWMPINVTGARSPRSGACPDGRAPDLQMLTDSELVPLKVGSPVRAFRPYVYKLYTRHRHWWLGRRLRGGRLEPIAGPFSEPRRGGLRLEYLTGNGIVTDDPAAVEQVRISVKAVELGTAAGVSDSDSLSTIVFLRNS